jgi:hypothetical protein
MNNETFFIFAPANTGNDLDTLYLTKRKEFKLNASIEDLLLFDTMASAMRYIDTNGLEDADFDIITNF